MFNKKSDVEEPRQEPAMSSSERSSPPASRPTSSSSKTAATIGPTIRIRGDLSGEEDLLVQGTVEGTVDLPKNLVTIGQEGRVNATVNARTVQVEGAVEGDLNGNEQVVLRRSGQVRGNITAPRVTLEDGCRFKGSIDMDVDSGGAKVADIKPQAASGVDDPSKKMGGRG